jgi:hypothetical protein
MAEPKTFWQRLRTLSVQLLIGLSLGVLIWELIGFRLLGLKYGSFGSSVTCSPDVNAALAEFDGGLRTSALLGAVGFVAAKFVVQLWWRRRQATTKQTPA